jgi:hypothetical protein
MHGQRPRVGACLGAADEDAQFRIPSDIVTSDAKSQSNFNKSVRFDLDRKAPQQPLTLLAQMNFFRRNNREPVDSVSLRSTYEQEKT